MQSGSSSWLHTMASLGLYAQTPPATSLAFTAFLNCRRRFHATFMYMPWKKNRTRWLIPPISSACWGQERNPLFNLHLTCWWLSGYKINWVQPHPKGTNSCILFWIQPFFKLHISWSTRLGSSITLPAALFLLKLYILYFSCRVCFFSFC